MDMPLELLATICVNDPATKVFDPEGDGYGLGRFSGVAGAELDATSGVLTMTFTPFTDTEPSTRYLDPQDFDKTTVRFVEVEKLVSVMVSHDLVGVDREDLKTILAEILDAQDL